MKNRNGDPKDFAPTRRLTDSPIHFKSLINWLSIFSLYLAVLLAVAYWSDSFGESVLKDQLITVIPVFLKINFFMIGIGLILNIKGIKKIFAGMRPEHAALLLFVAAAGFALSMFLAPRTHRDLL